MNAEIISIGTELLLGHITDTNATFLAQELSGLGIDLFYVRQIGDNQGRLVEALRQAWARSDLTICTGGIGPTEDDTTREAIAELLGEPMVRAPELEQTLRDFFASRRVRMPDTNLKQATKIPSATILDNPIGTAPGWFVEREGHIIVAMPGVPTEMKRMWQQEVVPHLRARSGLGVIFTRILRVIGIGESTVEQSLRDYLSQTNPTIATYAKHDGIDVRITAKAATQAEAEALVTTLDARVREILGDAVFGTGSETLARVLGQLLQHQEKSLATMESCTGGLLASTITDEEGSSKTFMGGLVAYSTDLKREWGVPQAILDAHGAVSRETALEMARAVRERLHASIGLAVTGVAGPDEQEGKPVGTLHIGISSEYGEEVVSPVYKSSRTEVKRLAVLAALNVARRHLLATSSRDEHPRSASALP